MAEKSIRLNKDIKCEIISRANSALTKPLRIKRQQLAVEFGKKIQLHMLGHWGFNSVGELKAAIPEDFRSETTSDFGLTLTRDNGTRQDLCIAPNKTTRLSEEDTEKAGGILTITLPAQCASHRYYKAAVLGVGRSKDVMELYQKHDAEDDKITNAIYEIETHLSSLVNSCKTSKQLRDTWPEGAEHYDKVLREHGDAGYALAVSSDNLKAALKSAESLG